MTEVRIKIWSAYYASTGDLFSPAQTNEIREIVLAQFYAPRKMVSSDPLKLGASPLRVFLRRRHDLTRAHCVFRAPPKVKVTARSRSKHLPRAKLPFFSLHHLDLCPFIARSLFLWRRKGASRRENKKDALARWNHPGKRKWAENCVCTCSIHSHQRWRVTLSLMCIFPCSKLGTWLRKKKSFEEFLPRSHDASLDPLKAGEWIFDTAAGGSAQW